MNLTVKDMALCALFAALISIGAAFSIPFPGGTPLSVQPIFAILAGAILGSKRGAISMIVYTLMGLIGLPVFSNFGGGIAYVKMPSFGFIIGFIVCAYVVGLIVEYYSKKGSIEGYYIGPAVGLFIIYLFGLPYLYMILTTVFGKDMTLHTTLKAGMYPFIALDIVKVVIAASLARSIAPRLKKMNLV